jgi:hypothetical protein
VGVLIVPDQQSKGSFDCWAWLISVETIYYFGVGELSELFQNRLLCFLFIE